LLRDHHADRQELTNVTAQTGFLAITTTSAARAVSGALRHGIWRPAAVGVLAGAVLALVSPFAAAVAALSVSAVGIGLSEGQLRGTARPVMYAGLGLLVPALVAVIARMAGLL
jgi:hypothetical protein